MCIRDRIGNDAEHDNYVNADAKVSNVYLTFDTAIDVKTAAKDVFGDYSYVVKFINDFADGSFVGVVVKSTTSEGVDGNVTITVNAKYNSDSGTKAANYSGSVVDGKATGTIIITEGAFTSWNATVTAKKVNFGPANYTNKSVTVDGATKLATDYNLVSTVKNGNLDVTISKNQANVYDTNKLAAGVYTVAIGNDVTTETIEISFVVD